MKTEKIYMAGPLFTWYDRDFNMRLAGVLRNHGYEVFLPQESEQNEENIEGRFQPRAIFASDIVGIAWADTILANLDGADVDSGTAWECGFAKGLGKKVLAYRLDFRSIHRDTRVNLTLSESADIYYEFPMEYLGYSFYEISRKIIKLLEAPIIRETTRPIIATRRD